MNGRRKYGASKGKRGIKRKNKEDGDVVNGMA